MGTLRLVLAVGVTVTLGAGCAVNGENLSGTGGHSTSVSGPIGGAHGGVAGAGGVGGAAIGAGGQGGVLACSCTPTNDPVCGVDGVSYSNACEAGCYGVAVAHQGACSADDGGDVPNSCNSDSDCVVVPFGCCSWTCQARGVFAPDPTVVCNMACPVGPPVKCGCANQTCSFWGGGAAGTSGGGAAGNGGAAGSSGTAGTSGTAGSSGSAGSSGYAGSSGVGGAAGGSSCDDLDRAYVAALAVAQQCDVGASGACQQEASPSLSPCTYSCPTISVNDATALNLIKAAWLQQGCEVAPGLCPAIACVQPAGGACVAGDGGGRCQTLRSGTTY